MLAVSKTGPRGKPSNHRYELNFDGEESRLARAFKYRFPRREFEDGAHDTNGEP